MPGTEDSRPDDNLNQAAARAKSRASFKLKSINNSFNISLKRKKEREAEAGEAARNESLTRQQVDNNRTRNNKCSKNQSSFKQANPSQANSNVPKKNANPASTVGADPNTPGSGSNQTKTVDNDLVNVANENRVILNVGGIRHETYKVS